MVYHLQSCGVPFAGEFWCTLFGGLDVYPLLRFRCVPFAGFLGYTFFMRFCGVTFAGISNCCTLLWSTEVYPLLGSQCVPLAGISRLTVCLGHMLLPLRGSQLCGHD